MRDTNFYVKHGWMINRLKLKSSDLDIYAIIYGFCQDEESEYCGSIDYLVKSSGYSYSTVIRSLNKLVENGFLIKNYIIKSNGRYSSYKVNFQKINQIYPNDQKTTGGGMCQNDTTHCVKMTHNKIPSFPPKGEKEGVGNNSKKDELFSTTTIFDEFVTIWNKFHSQAKGNTSKCQKLTLKRKRQLKKILDIADELRKQRNSDKTPIRFIFEDIIIPAWQQNEYLNGEKRGKGYDTPLPFTIDFVSNPDNFTRMVEFLYK